MKEKWKKERLEELWSDVEEGKMHEKNKGQKEKEKEYLKKVTRTIRIKDRKKDGRNTGEMKGQGSKTGKQWALEKQRRGKDGFSQFDCRILLSASAKPEVIFTIYGYYTSPLLQRLTGHVTGVTKEIVWAWAKWEEKKLGVKEE